MPATQVVTVLFQVSDPPDRGDYADALTRLSTKVRALLRERRWTIEPDSASIVVETVDETHKKMTGRFEPLSA
jgi:hypothetical protein